MTLSCPSFLAAATRAFVPPASDRSVAVDTFLLLVLALLPDELLLQPAANIRLPIAAEAAIAYLPRKISLPSPSHVAGKSRRSWLDPYSSWLDKLAGR